MPAKKKARKKVGGRRKKRASKKKVAKKKRTLKGPVGTIRKIKGRYYRKGKGGVVRAISAAAVKKIRAKKRAKKR